MVAPTSSTASSATRNSATLLLQRHFRLGEMLTLRLGDVLLLGFTRAELDGDIAVHIFAAERNDLAIFKAQARSRGRACPSSWNNRVIPTFRAITPVRMIKTPYRGL